MENNGLMDFVVLETTDSKALVFLRPEFVSGVAFIGEKDAEVLVGSSGTVSYKVTREEGLAIANVIFPRGFVGEIAE